MSIRLEPLPYGSQRGSAAVYNTSNHARATNSQPAARDESLIRPGTIVTRITQCLGLQTKSKINLLKHFLQLLAGVK